jgi:hypothetical protein
MLIKLTSVRAKTTMEDASTQAQEAARKYINVASAML